MSAPHPFRDRLQSLLTDADIRIDGDRPWDMQVHDAHLPARLVAGGTHKPAETNMD
jgi:cyclopropane-fatty-acyl-phospholipid synthase